MDSNLEYDAVVVGGGISGLVTGLRLAEQSVRVAVLERGEGAKYLSARTFQ